MSDIIFMTTQHMPTVKSWLDNYPTWKLLAPPLMTGSVTAFMASMAYFVARSQREIAANKYNLDLFDKRYPLYEEFEKELKIFIDKDYSYNPRIYKKYYDRNQRLIDKISILYANTKSELINFKEKSKLICELCDELRDMQSKTKSYIDSDFEDINGIDKKIKSLQKEIKEASFDSKLYGDTDRNKKKIELLKELKTNFNEIKKDYENNKKELKNKQNEIDKNTSDVKKHIGKVYDEMTRQLDISHDAYKRFSFFSIIKFQKRNKE